MAVRVPKRPLPWQRLDVTKAQRRLAIDRTDFLLDYIGHRMSLSDLLANAYLQGLIDAAEAMAILNPAPAEPSPAEIYHGAAQ